MDIAFTALSVRNLRGKKVRGDVRCDVRGTSIGDRKEADFFSLRTGPDGSVWHIRAQVSEVKDEGCLEAAGKFSEMREEGLA
jgi:hypothetical protein